VLDDRAIGRVVHAASSPSTTWAGSRSGSRRGRRTSARSPHPYHKAEPSDLFDCGDVDVRVLAANVAPTGSNANSESWITNSASIVLRLHREVGGAGFTAILIGDATFATERAMLAAYANEPGLLDADLLRVGHHGTDVTSSSPEWFAATTPEVAVVSAGHHGGFRHPRCSVVERVVGLDSMDTVACHEATCGNPNAGGPALGSCDQNWCRVATEAAFYDTLSSGDVTVEFYGQVRVMTERGLSEGCGS
jgi:hypothetical protein